MHACVKDIGQLYRPGKQSHYHYHYYYRVPSLKTHHILSSIIHKCYPSPVDLMILMEVHKGRIKGIAPNRLITDTIIRVHDRDLDSGLLEVVLVQVSLVEDEDLVKDAGKCLLMDLGVLGLTKHLY